MTFLDTHWNALTLSLLAVGVVAGFAAIVGSLWGKRPLSIGLACVGLLASLLLPMLCTIGKDPTVYLVLAFPAALGGVALVLNWLLGRSEGLAPRQITITTLLFLTAVVAAAVGMVKATQVPVLNERDVFERHIRQMKGVAEVTIPGHFAKDNWYPQAVILQIKGYPESVVVLQPHYGMKIGDRDEAIPDLIVEQIGPYKFMNEVAYQVDGNWVGSHPGHGLHLGTKGIYQDDLPVRVESLGDIIDNYQQLCDFFEKEWPREEMRGTKDIPTEVYPFQVKYWLEVDPNVPMP